MCHSISNFDSDKKQLIFSVNIHSKEHHLLIIDFVESPIVQIYHSLLHHYCHQALLILTVHTQFCSQFFVGIFIVFFILVSLSFVINNRKDLMIINLLFISLGKCLCFFLAFLHGIIDISLMMHIFYILLFCSIKIL